MKPLLHIKYSLALTPVRLNCFKDEMKFKKKTAIKTWENVYSNNKIPNMTHLVLLLIKNEGV